MYTCLWIHIHVSWPRGFKYLVYFRFLIQDTMQTRVLEPETSNIGYLDSLSPMPQGSLGPGLGAIWGKGPEGPSIQSLLAIQSIINDKTWIGIQNPQILDAWIFKVHIATQ